jgi:hypothetical protein
MVSLSDDEMQIVLDGAKPLPAHDRDAFLRDIAAAMEGGIWGGGAVHRLVRQTLARHYAGREPRRSARRKIVRRRTPPVG